MAEEFAALATEHRNPRSEAIDQLSTVDVLRTINSDDQAVPAAVGGAIERIAVALDAIVERVRSGGRLFYAGAGTSGRLGVLDASECPPTFGVSPDLVQGIIAGGEPALTRAIEGAEDDPARGAADLASRNFGAADSLVGIATSGRTPYVLGALRAAREAGGLAVALACVTDSKIGSEAEIAIEIPVGPEVITGSTRMKAGTATKLVLNMISTGLMIRLGYTYGNLMVNVQPKNEKLRDRAARIVAEAAQVGVAEARARLEEAGWDVRTAILIARYGMSREEAARRLMEKGGVLAEVLHGSV